MSEHSARPASSGDGRRSAAWWVIAVCLSIIAWNMTFRAEPLVPQALAQVSRSAGARGIFAFTGHVTPTTHGVYMVDVDTGTLWCYEWATTANGVKRLRLAAARSWIFDRYLEEYNVEGLSPSDVEQMVNEQRKRYEAHNAKLNP